MKYINIKTFNQRCNEINDDVIISETMLKQCLYEEIDELRKYIEDNAIGSLTFKKREEDNGLTEQQIKKILSDSKCWVGDVIGGNPNDLEHGFWDTEQDAIINFALQFAKLAENAQGNFLFVRKAPIICEEAMFDSNIKKWKMIGRFSISKLKEKNNG